MQEMEQTKRFVRETYRQIAVEGGDCCASSCCQDEVAETRSAGTRARLGYRDTELASVPHGSNLGLGCGNPHRVAELQEGETVLDLGSGGGLDCFLAARQVGSRGHVIGVDMTAEMVTLARHHLNDSDLDHVDFRLGEIEHLPVADGCIDVVMSNCVINLSPDKAAVFREARRVLKPGGRLAISDVVATAPLPSSLRRDLRMVASCLGGAATVSELTDMLSRSGFVDVRIETLERRNESGRTSVVPRRLHDHVVAATIQARKSA